MGLPRLITLDSVDSLRAAAAPWDDLWQRSGTASPTARAALIAQWLEFFAPGKRFQALVVEQDRRFLAALPLVERRVGRLVRAAGLPSNEWSPGADLLVDVAASAAAGHAVLDRLVAGIRQIPWPLLWIDGASRDSAHWQALLAALDRAGCGHAYHELFRIPQVAIDGDWDAYQAAWSGNHRRHMRKAMKKVDAAALRLRTFTSGTPDEIAAAVREGFGVEDRSWKGQTGSSVMKTPGMLEFFTRQSEVLAELGHLHLVLLDQAETPMAFEYGWSAKCVYFTPKVGYDEAFAGLTPSQMLRFKLFARFFAERSHRLVDFFGPTADATSKWRTGDYSLGRLVVSTRHLTSGPLLWAYRSARPKLKALKHWATSKSARKKQSAPTPEPEAIAG